MRFMIYFAALMALWPFAAVAVEAVKNPSNYSIKEYAFILGVSILGGVVSWFSKVHKGDVSSAYRVSQLVGELATSALAGLIAFWMCEWAGLAPLLTATLVGISGHAGTRALAWFERFAESKFGPGTPIDGGAK